MLFFYMFFLDFWRAWCVSPRKLSRTVWFNLQYRLPFCWWRNWERRWDRF
jgi:hypothetical protein